MVKAGVVQAGCVATMLPFTMVSIERCDCQCSKMLPYYPDVSCNEHTMNVRIAIRLTRSILRMFSGCLLEVPRTLGRREASFKALLSKDEGSKKIGIENHREEAFCQVRRFLRKREERRTKERPPLKRISWTKRPKWNGSIIDLTPGH